MSETTPIELITSTVTAYLKQPNKLQRATTQFHSRVPADQQALVNDVLTATPVSYRDGLMIQLAYGLCSAQPIDLTKPGEADATPQCCCVYSLEQSSYSSCPTCCAIRSDEFEDGDFTVTIP